jgi:hypothetical protein
MRRGRRRGRKRKSGKIVLGDDRGGGTVTLRPDQTPAFWSFRGLASISQEVFYK